MSFGSLARTLEYIRWHRAEHGRSPVLRDIAAATQCSCSIAQERVHTLARLGFVSLPGDGWRLCPIPTLDNQVVRFADVRDVLKAVDMPQATADSVLKRLVGLALHDAAQQQQQQAGKPGRRRRK